MSLHSKKLFPQIEGNEEVDNNDLEKLIQEGDQILKEKYGDSAELDLNCLKKNAYRKIFGKNE